jgi:pyruvate,water dikinase
MPTGAVLVAPATDPGWTPLFARAAAVVVEIGGLFSHAATVAREYGLPAVSNVEGVTDLLRDGDVVRVDGARGVVEVLQRAP